MLKNKNNWFVLVTKPRNEKKVESKLNEIGIEAYCPVRTELRQWSDRKMKIKIPLLPSMLLVKIPNNLRNVVFDVPHVLRYLFWQGQPAVVREDEVSVLRKVADQEFSSVRLHKFTPGTKIDLKPFGISDSIGTVKYTSGNQCCVVIDSLGYMLKFQLS
ncbi:MAG: UpxY family transcription antiterminator [Flavobacteriaceae bacterium]|jgi:transcription antitermination factor NusG